MFELLKLLPFLRSPVIAGLLCFFLGGFGLCKAEAAEGVETVRRLYQKAQRLVAEGESEEALERFLTLSQKYPQSEWAAASLWEVYRISIHQGDDESAFEALNRLIIGQPGHFEKAHTAQLQLVKRLLGGGREARRSLEPVRRSQTTPPEIIQGMLKTIIKNGPQSEVGIQAHYYLGIALEKSGEFKEAIAMHEDFAETYPQHELADDAGYQVGYIAYKQWKNMRSTGPHQRENAAIYLAWFIAKFPESDKVAQARSCLSEVRSAELRELMSLARFYESRGNEKAAAIYHEQIASQFPEAVIADNELRKKVMKAAESSSEPNLDRVGPAR